MTVESPSWVQLKRTSLGIGVLGIGEILAVQFLIFGLGRQLYSWTGLPSPDQFIFVEDLATVDFMGAVPYELATLGLTFGLALLTAVLVGIIRGRRSRLSYGLQVRSQGFLRLTGIGILAGSFIWLLPNSLKLVDHYLLDIGPGTGFWVLQEQVPWGLGYWLDMAIASFVLIPLAEEFLVRGYVMGRLNESFRPGESILIVAFIFAFGHGQYLRADALSIGSLISICINSTLLGYLVFRTGSLWPAIVAHALVNLPATYPWKLGLLGIFLTLLIVHGRQVSRFARETTAFVRAHTRPGVLLIALPLPAWLILAHSEKIPYPEVIDGVCIALGLASLLVRSAWRTGTSRGIL